jgi:hypothetical protein
MPWPRLVRTARAQLEAHFSAPIDRHAIPVLASSTRWQGIGRKEGR